MSEEFLDGADVIAVFEEVGGEGVAEDVRSDGFVYFCETGGAFDCTLEVGFVEVVPLFDAAGRVNG